MFHLDLDSSQRARRPSVASSADSGDEHWIPAGTSPSHSSLDDTSALRKRFEHVLALDGDARGEMEAIVEDSSESDRETGEGEREIPINRDYAAEEAGDFVPTRKMSPRDFEPVRVLGKGAYGKVILVRQRETGRLFAQKQLKKASLRVRHKVVEYTRAERNILQAVRHPFICKLYYAFQDFDQLYLILEYAQGGELFQHLAIEKMLPEASVAFYAAELALALHHLHSLGIVYRDLKPENCLLDAQGHVLLADFGLSKVRGNEQDAQDENSDVGGGQCRSIVGTIEYMAPEMLLEEPYDYAVDWWAFGVMIYDMLTGSPPFTGSHRGKILDKIVKNKLNLPFFLSPDAKDVLRKLLKRAPHARLGWDDVTNFAAVKKHRFFRRIDWVKLERHEIEPPMVPVITQPELAENFAHEFTSMPIVSPQDPVPGPAIAVAATAAAAAAPAVSTQHLAAPFGETFSGFTYVAPNSYF